MRHNTHFQGSMATTEEGSLRQLCWTRALHSHGSGYIFSRVAQSHRKRLRWLTFFGIATPLLVGSIALTFGTDTLGFAALLIVASVVGVAQLVIAAWALVAGWENSFSYASESTADNYRIADAFERLAMENPSDLAQRFAVLDAEYQSRSASDNKQHFPDALHRLGMRAGLRRFQRSCAGCKQVPTSMESTSCSVCGNFETRRVAWIRK